ncbi:MAG: hypothetical protein IT435_17380 [Phycisphaerales bacterium]|nr:hypothetical protein [Phycisphaerales bacterium]
MLKAWSGTDERQHEHIKSSELKKGQSTSRARQVAAATVSTQRCKEGRTMASSFRSAARR